MPKKVGGYPASEGRDSERSGAVPQGGGFTPEVSAEKQERERMRDGCYYGGNNNVAGVGSVGALMRITEREMAWRIVRWCRGGQAERRHGERGR